MLTARPRSRRAAAGWAVRRLRELGDPIALAAARTPGPLPPRRLRARVGAPGIREFAEGGQRAAAELAQALDGMGLPALPSRAAILDFGCGAGRVLPHVAALAPGAHCTGCDVDAEAIAWAADHHPDLRFAASAAAPPLPFADGSFDLIYSISVFSHLDAPLADGWLVELRRLLRPGGIALLSVHGPHAFEAFRSGRVSSGWCDSAAFGRAPLTPDEFVFVPYARSLWNAGDLPGVSADYGLAFHGSGYLRAQWGKALEVCGVLPAAVAGWQDVVACRRPA